MRSKTAAQLKQMIKAEQEVYSTLLFQHASQEGAVYYNSPAFMIVIVPLFMPLSRWAGMRAITRHYTFPQLMQPTSRFHFLVALGLPGSDTYSPAFSSTVVRFFSAEL